MPRTPSPLPLAPPFSVTAARAAGVTVRRLRAGDLAAPFTGVRTAVDGVGSADGRPLAFDRAEQARVRRLAEAYARVMPTGAFFCGRTAAVLHGGPVPAGADLEVGVLAPERAVRRRGIRGRKLAANLVDLTVVDGLSVTSPASTWAMLGAELSVRALVRLGDAFVRIPRDDHGHPRPEAQLCTPESLRDAAAAGRRVGIARLMRALELIRVGSMSPLETDARLDLCAGGLPEPVLDAQIVDAHGIRIAIADAAYPAYRVVVEIEGDHHRTDRAQWTRDIDRQADLAAAGWEVVRLTAAHIRGGRAAPRVRAALQRHGWPH